MRLEIGGAEPPTCFAGKRTPSRYPCRRILEYSSGLNRGDENRAQISQDLKWGNINFKTLLRPWGSSTADWRGAWNCSTWGYISVFCRRYNMMDGVALSLYLTNCTRSRPVCRHDGEGNLNGSPSLNFAVGWANSSLLLMLVSPSSLRERFHETRAHTRRRMRKLCAAFRDKWTRCKKSAARNILRNNPAEKVTRKTARGFHNTSQRSRLGNPLRLSKYGFMFVVVYFLVFVVVMM